MKCKFYATAALAAALLLTLTACGKPQSPATSGNLDTATQQTEQRQDVETSASEEPATHGEEPTETETAPTDREEPTETETAPTDREEPTETEAAPADGEEAWKEGFEESLFNNFGVIPEYYEDLGDGIYQVYVEVGGEVIPFVTVDSATGDYHG